MGEVMTRTFSERAAGKAEGGAAGPDGEGSISSPSWEILRVPGERGDRAILIRAPSRSNSKEMRLCSLTSPRISETAFSS